MRNPTIIITEKDQKILDKYPEINYKKYLGKENTIDSLQDLLDEIYDAYISYRDERDEPLPRFLELEGVQDRIFYENAER